MKPPDRQEMAMYTKQTNAVLDFIHGNLDGSLSLERLSAIASFSPYHFHRVFKLIVGETLLVYVNRTRIDKACRFLAFHENLSMREISLECGFSSLAGFSRTFRAIHGMSPTEYRLRFHAFKPWTDTLAEQRFRLAMEA